MWLTVAGDSYGTGMEGNFRYLLSENFTTRQINYAMNVGAFTVVLRVN